MSLACGKSPEELELEAQREREMERKRYATELYDRSKYAQAFEEALRRRGLDFFCSAEGGDRKILVVAKDLSGDLEKIRYTILTDSTAIDTFRQYGFTTLKIVGRKGAWEYDLATLEEISIPTPKKQK
jgi:hypothetical protein